MTLARTETPLNPIELTLLSLRSENSKVAYRKALEDFFAWLKAQAKPQLTKHVLNQYVESLQGRGLSASTINQRLSALRRMLRELSDNELLDAVQAERLAKIKGISQKGKKSGQWLTRDQAQALLLAPDSSSLAGHRDRAILAVMLGCGLRRSEIVALDFSHLQQREGRWVVLDLLGKGGRVRTVPMPAWTKNALDTWTLAAGLSSGKVFRPLTPRGHHLTAREEISDETISGVVKKYGSQVGYPGLAPHDLRRTFAKLAHKGKSPIDQIQLSLGHASIVTTEIYLGVSQNLEEAPCDVLGLSLKS